MQVDQRAWIAAEKFDPHPLPLGSSGDSTEITVTIKNHGKTPARKVIAIAVVEPVVMDQAPMFEYPELPVRVGMLQPGVEHILQLYPLKSRTTGKPGPITPEILAALQSGKIVLHVHGRIAYEDVFAYSHW